MLQIFKDVSFRLSPINELSGRYTIESTKASKLLYGIRGKKTSYMESIVKSLQRLSQLVIHFRDTRDRY